MSQSLIIKHVSVPRFVFDYVDFSKENNANNIQIVWDYKFSNDYHNKVIKFTNMVINALIHREIICCRNWPRFDTRNRGQFPFYHSNLFFNN